MAEFEQFENEIRQLKAKLAKREEEVQLAGKIGKELLQQTEKSNEVIHALENERARHLEEIQDLQSREAAALRLLENLKAVADEKTNELEIIREKMGTFASLGLDQAMKQMKDEIARSERLLEDEKDRYRSLLDDYNELQAREEVLRSQLREAESFTATLETTSESLKKDKERLRDSEELVERMERDNRRMKDEMEEMRNQKNIEMAACESMRQEMRVQGKATKMITQQKISLEAENCELKRQLGVIEQKHKGDMSRKHEELRAVRQEAERGRYELNQIMTEKKKLQEQCLHLAKENQNLYKEQEENQAFLDEAHRTVKRLQFAADESHAAASLGELEAGLNKRIDAEREKIEKRGKQEMENCEEYFYLAATAVRIEMAVRYPHQSDPLFRINAKSLFDLCMKNDIPFHKWHEWLSNEYERRMRESGTPLTTPQPKGRAPQGTGRGGRGRGGGSSQREAPPPTTGGGILDNLSKALFE